MERARLDGRITMVTGAAGGIGSAVCSALADRGAIIAAVDVDQRRLADQVARRCGEGHKTKGYELDVADSGAVDRVVAGIERDLGPIRILVNVAGVLRTGPILELSDEDWERVLAVNATGALHVSRAVGRRMAQRRSGSIVTVASNAGGVPRMHMGAYCASKAASAMLTKCLGLELARYGVRCNVVSPGSTDTTMLRSMWEDEDGPRATIDGSLEAYRVGIPLRKLARPSDVAEAVAFLVSDQADHITMHDLYVDGGAALR